jgi:hypothetical protein
MSKSNTDGRTLGTAKMLGLTVPNAIQLIADEIIE